ncbi:MAG: AraC family transcriptional regulator [Cellulosilyticaceae bacterium]
MLTNTLSIDLFNPHIMFIIHGVTDKDHLYTCSYHSHDFLELSIVTDGEIDYLINDKHYHLTKGDVLVSNPGTLHQALITPDTTCEEIHIGITNLHIDSSCQMDTIQAPNLEPIVHIARFYKEFLECCHLIKKEQRLRSLGHTFTLKALVMQLIILLYREMRSASESDTPFASDDKQVVIQNMIDYMTHHYMEDITLDTLSKMMFISPTYISKIFKEETGTSPINYLIQIRLEKALELLEKENIPISTVSKMVGYQDAYYFSKLFKKNYGFPPSQIKKLSLV